MQKHLRAECSPAHSGGIFTLAFATTFTTFTSAFTTFTFASTALALATATVAAPAGAPTAARAATSLATAATVAATTPAAAAASPATALAAASPLEVRCRRRRLRQPGGLGDVVLLGRAGPGGVRRTLLPNRRWGVVQ